MIDFEKWCDSQVCYECEYQDLHTQEDCKREFYKINNGIGGTLKKIEMKLDVIMKHLNIEDGRK